MRMSRRAAHVNRLIEIGQSIEIRLVLRPAVDATQTDSNCSRNGTKQVASITVTALTSNPVQSYNLIAYRF
jgi:hypothetical protein